MIITVCPNPCIDCTLELEKFNVGRLNRIEHKIERWAGKALNTAIGIARLGKDVTASGFMFDSGGRRCVNYLEREGVKSRFVWNRGRLRVNYKIIDGRSMMTELNDRGDKVSAERQGELLSVVSKLTENASYCVISGSLPGGVEDDYYKKLVQSVSENARAVVDCESGKMLSALSAGVFLVKPNLEELQEVNGESYSSIKDMLAGANKLITLGAEIGLLSLGSDGALITDGSRAFYTRTENVAVNSTVGAGDSMLAAACVAFESGESMEEALKWGVAAGTAAITTPAGELFRKDKFREIYQKLTTKKLYK